MPNLSAQVVALAVTATLAGLLFSPAGARAGEFTVSPTRLELGASARSGAITVRNEGKQPLSFQLQASQWLQDAQGQDQYTDTVDLVFFPKIMTVQPGQEGVVRVGTRSPVTPEEKTYRLFIEELPPAEGPAGGAGAQITFLIRFGAPIFVVPVKPQDGLELPNATVHNGELRLVAKNTGNRHQMVQGIRLKGTDAAGNEVYAMTLADRYLLAGVAKPYTTTLGREQCIRMAQLEIEFRTDKGAASHKLDLTRTMCAGP